MALAPSRGMPLVLLVLGAALQDAPVSAFSVPPAVAPLWLSGPVPGTPVRVLPTPGGLLLGSSSGLYRLEDGGWALLLTRGGVLDLARAQERTLVATSAGLYELPDRSSTARPVGLGAGARVAALAVDAEGRAWVGTAVGLFTRAPGEAAFRRNGDLPAGPVVAVREASGQVWVATPGAIWVREGEGGFERRLRRLDPGWFELSGAVRDAGGVILSVPKGLWRIDARGARPIQLGLGELRAMTARDGTGWIATERGVFPLSLGRLETGAARAALEFAVFDLAVEDGRLVVASERGVATLPLQPPRVRAPTPALSAGRGKEVSKLQRAVLSYLGLTTSRIERVEGRARRAALLPQVRVNLALERDRERDRKLDEAFTGGALRQLYDTSSGYDRGLGVELQLTWSLDDLRQPDHALAISRERRELIELRDQVLERVNRLYFERLRVLAQVAALDPESASAERAELEIRARELTAHLDGWSGGVFSRLEASSPLSTEQSP